MNVRGCESLLRSSAALARYLSISTTTRADEVHDINSSLIQIGRDLGLTNPHIRALIDEVGSAASEEAQ